MLGKMSALEAVIHPELDGSGTAFSDLDVLEHSAVQNVADTSQVVRTQVCMVKSSRKSSRNSIWLSWNGAKSAFCLLQGFLGAGVFAGQG
jgi:hypothetical protein